MIVAVAEYTEPPEGHGYLVPEPGAYYMTWQATIAPRSSEAIVDYRLVHNGCPVPGTRMPLNSPAKNIGGAHLNAIVQAQAGDELGIEIVADIDVMILEQWLYVVPL